VGFATPYVTGQAQLPSLGLTPDGNTPDSGLEQPDIPTNAQDISEEFESFWDTFTALDQEYYYQPVDREKLIYGAAKGMVESLGDDFSNFLTPEENAQVKSSFEGNFEGVGMYIERRNELPTVVAPIPNTPASRAGVRANDIILAVDGRDVTAMQPDQVATLVRGPAGTKVRIKFAREGEPEPFEIELIRERIEVPSVTYTKQGDYAWLQVSVFNQKTTPELDAALNQAQADGAKGVILDLRNNGGGFVTSALEMLGRFLPEGEVGFYESRKADGSDDRPQRVISNGPKLLDIPLVVLINGGSASASELVSGALQDYERAVLIGEQSFGKGSEQHVYDLDDGSQARITFAHWLTPKKRDINPKATPTPDPNQTPTPQPTFTPTPIATIPPAAATATAEAAPLVTSQPDRGLTPDIVVVRTNKDYAEDKDPQLDRAIEYLTNGR
jgi:carboxyl-terminal processing protease